MKRILPFLFSSVSFLISYHSNAQCTEIVRPTFHIITDGSNPCLRSVTFDYIPKNNGRAGISLTVTVNGSTVISECISFQHMKDIQTNYTSAEFTACNLLLVEVSITPFNGNQCQSAGNGCSPTLFSSGGAPLPVLFSGFSVTRNRNLVTLKWETATEINNSGFVIERNSNGDWQQAGFVATQALHGNSSDQLSYEFSEINNNKSMTQYRLRQVDMDGAFKYSDIRAIRGTEQDVKTTVFPNPSVNGNVNLVFGGAGVRDIVITDLAGRTVKQWNGYNSNSLQVTGLGAGMFSIRISDRVSGSQSTEKIIVAAR